MELANDDERLVAEQAVLGYRELIGVMRAAPHGKGLAVLEQAVRERVFEQMRNSVYVVLDAQRVAQQIKVCTAGPVSAGGSRPTSNGALALSC